MEELTALATKLETKDGGPKAKKFAQKIHIAMSRFEAGEDVRSPIPPVTWSTYEEEA